MIDPPHLKIWTIGHSNHSLDHFIDLLTQHEITLLADVRSFPGSRTFPHFSQENLASASATAGITYRWFQGLGGRRPKQKTQTPSPNEGWRNKSFRNYADYMMTADFKHAFARLRQAASAQRTAIMCSESVYWRCHRRLISDYLVAQGGHVEHIFPDGHLKPHTLTPEAVIEPGDPPQVIYPGEPNLCD